MNIKYMKDLDLTNANERQVFITSIFNRKPTGNITFVNDFVELSMDIQTEQNTLKGYLFAISEILRRQTNFGTHKSYNVKDRKAITKIVVDIAKQQQIETFSFYGNMMTLVWSVLSDNSLSMVDKISVYAFSHFIEKEMISEKVKFSSFSNLLERESGIFQTKVKTTIKFFETIG